MIKKGYVTATHGQIHYREAGDRSQRPLVLLHQTASSSIMYAALMELLSADFWLLAPDNPGFGNSDPLSSTTMNGYAKALEQFLDAHSISDCLLFGHHTGASIATAFTAQFPEMVKRLILCGPTLLTGEQIRYLRTTLQSFTPDKPFVDAIWERTAGKSAETDPNLLYRETLLTLQAGPHLSGAYHAVFEQDTAAQLATIHCPTLVMAGEHDSLVKCVEPTAAVLSNAQTRIIPNAGTYICDEQPSLMAGILREFFNHE